jgi:FkbM family methyltransferase
MSSAAIEAAVKRVVCRSLARVGLTLEHLPNRLGPGHHLINLMRTYGVDCVLDVGANEGQFAAMLRESGYEGRIVSFEPLAESYDKLLAAAAGDPFWSTRQLALGDRAGTITLNVTASKDVVSVLAPQEWWSEQWVGARVERTVEAAATTLDDLAREIPYQRLFLKIDTQGYDLRVLAGARALLERVVGVQVEMSSVALYEGMPDYIETLQAMRDIGFAPSAVFPVLSDERLRAIELDGVFVRA